jgi:hypothetical protein
MPNRLGVTPLHVAAGRGYPTAVEILLEYGASPDALIADLGKTAFDIAFHELIGSLIGEVSEGIFGDTRVAKKKVSRLLETESGRDCMTQYLDVLSRLLDDKGHPRSQQIYWDNESAALVTRPGFHKTKGMQTRVLIAEELH